MKLTFQNVKKVFLSIMVFGIFISSINPCGFCEDVKKVNVTVTAPQSDMAKKDIDLIEPKQSYTSAILERASSGFTNIVYGPLEIIYQLKEEVKRTDPLRGVIPGLAKGAGWFVTREVVGVFELVTFFIPKKPVLREFDTEWIYV